MFGLGFSSDSELVNQIKIGNEKALLTLYKQNIGAVKKHVLKNNGTIDEAEDVLQETIIAVWQNVAKPDFLLNVKLSTYVFSIAKNQWYKQLRKKSKFKVVDETMNENFKADETPLMYDVKIVRDYVNRLDETCRRLLMFFYFDGMDMNTIAKQMGFANSDTVKSKKYQCFKKLENDVKEHFQKDDFI
ncbi:MAG: sigma-70 family RNA polymerase sigma factor [Flavobacteriales bacterium]|nr:sigma-70 family RNA polymerase sigma factor [Flavobacteriales bacterium]